MGITRPGWPTKTSERGARNKAGVEESAVRRVSTIEKVKNSGRSALRLGCCGARAYMDALTDQMAVWGLPGEKLELYVGEIDTLAKANSVLTRFHQQRSADIESGGRPDRKRVVVPAVKAVALDLIPAPPCQSSRL